MVSILPVHFMQHQFKIILHLLANSSIDNILAQTAFTERITPVNANLRSNIYLRENNLLSNPPVIQGSTPSIRK